MKNNKWIGMLIISLVIAVITFFALQQSKILIKNQAIDNCLKSAKVEVKLKDGNTASTPDNYWFNFCMTKKGYK